MPIALGDRLPAVSLYELVDGKPVERSSEAVFAGKKVVLFALPGAFTPMCSNNHLPGFIEQAEAIKAKGVDEIVCLSVNDAFVMGAWGKANLAEGAVSMLADGSAAFTQALGLTLDLTERGFGVRSQRYALIANDGVVEYLGVEPGTELTVSGAPVVLKALD